MAVTKETYTATATWTASGLATLFQDAFIDASLMTAWHDSFASGGIENRVLKVINDGTKTYGTVYYWFMFTTSGVFLHTALDWNTGSDIPAGTQYLDYFSTTTNSTSNHRQLIALTSETTVSLIRYTSGEDPDCSWFVIKNGTTNACFLVPSPGYNCSAFVDQSKVAFNGIISALSTTSNSYTGVGFFHVANHTRRTYLGASALRGATLTYSSRVGLFAYRGIGNTNANPGSNIHNATSSNDLSVVGVWLPTAHANTQTGLVSDHTPVFTGFTASPYMAPLPSDFGIASYYASNVMAVEDKLVVSAGTEEWEMLFVAGNSSTDSSRLLLLARIV